MPRSLKMCDLEAAIVASGMRAKCSAETAAALRDGLECEHVGSALDVYMPVVQPLEAEGIVEAAQALDLSQRIYSLLSLAPNSSRKRRASSELDRRSGAHSGASAKGVLAAPEAGPAAPTALERLSWKREYKSDHERFHDDYSHDLCTLPPHAEGAVRCCRLTLKQKPFHIKASGFASTVWDSSIVLSRAIERWVMQEHSISGRTFLELGSGCGLVGLTAAALGGRVTLTDLPCNLPLLRANVSSLANREALACSEHPPEVRSLDWTAPVPSNLVGSVDVILATDVFYAGCPVNALAQMLSSLSKPGAQAWLAAGRNRAGIDAFFGKVETEWSMRKADPDTELDALYQSDDVDVWILERRAALSVLWVHD